MKLISWNVNGLRACMGKGFPEFFQEADADIFCIQETKMQEGQLKLELDGYYQYWNYAVKKGYSGTAVFTKKEKSYVREFVWQKERRRVKRMMEILFRSLIRRVRTVRFPVIQ